MTLTSHLDNPASPVGQYIKFVAAIVDNAKRGRPLGKELQTFLDSTSGPN